MSAFKTVLNLEDAQIKSLWGIINSEKEENIEKAKLFDLVDMIMSESEFGTYNPYQMIENLEILTSQLFNVTELNEVPIAKILTCKTHLN